MHGAAGEGKGLQMHGGSSKGELGLASSCVLLWVPFPAVGMVPWPAPRPSALLCRCSW